MMGSSFDYYNLIEKCLLEVPLSAEEKKKIMKRVNHQFSMLASRVMMAAQMKGDALNALEVCDLGPVDQPEVIMQNEVEKDGEDDEDDIELPDLNEPDSSRPPEASPFIATN